MTLVAAPVIGFAFGWFLERAGLGSARKLAGQFYFTDLTVFKVMFSALVTAMLGAFWLDRFGWVEVSAVYLPETFVWPQLVGGALFGAGFLIAGLCPGTSCVAAAAGRGDGLAVVGGLFVGVLLFNVGYEHLANFYNSGALGSVTLDDLFGASRGVMVAAVTAAALGAFAIIERGRPVMPLLLCLAVVAATFGLAAAASRDDRISTLDVAQRIMDGDRSLYLFDLRAPEEFDRAHIPSAQLATSDTLARESLPHDATIVIYSESTTEAARALAQLRKRGYRRVFVLRQGIVEWQARVMEPRLPVDATDRERADFARAVELSKFFGGRPLEGVPRSAAPPTIGMRRRGC